MRLLFLSTHQFFFYFFCTHAVKCLWFTRLCVKVARGRCPLWLTVPCGWFLQLTSRYTLNSSAVKSDPHQILTVPYLQVAMFGYLSYYTEEIRGDVLSNFPLNSLSQITRFGEFSVTCVLESRIAVSQDIRCQWLKNNIVLQANIVNRHKYLWCLLSLLSPPILLNCLLKKII